MFNGSKWRQQTRKPSHFGSHSASEPRIFRGLLGDFDPHTSYLGTKKYPSFTKSRICGGLKKRPPSYAKYVTGVQPPSIPECPPRGILLELIVCFKHKLVHFCHNQEGLFAFLHNPYLAFEHLQNRADQGSCCSLVSCQSSNFPSRQ